MALGENRQVAVLEKDPIFHTRKKNTSFWFKIQSEKIPAVKK